MKIHIEISAPKELLATKNEAGKNVGRTVFSQMVEVPVQDAPDGADQETVERVKNSKAIMALAMKQAAIVSGSKMIRKAVLAQHPDLKKGDEEKQADWLARVSANALSRTAPDIQPNTFWQDVWTDAKTVITGKFDVAPGTSKAAAKVASLEDEVARLRAELAKIKASKAEAEAEAESEENADSEE